MNELQLLINKFLDGNTTVEEEITLRQQLQALEHPDEEQRALMLMLGNGAKGVAMPDVMDLIASEAEYHSVMRRRKRLSMFIRVGIPAGVAAILLLALTLIPLLKNEATSAPLVAQTEPIAKPEISTPTPATEIVAPATPVEHKVESKQAVAQAHPVKTEPVHATELSIEPVAENHDVAMAVEPAIITSRIKTNSPVSDLNEISDLAPLFQ